MYYKNDTIVYFNGRFIKATEAIGNVYDQSLHYGYSVFEGIRSYSTAGGTQVFKAKEHYDRLQFSARAIGIPFNYNSVELIGITYELLQLNHLTDAYIRPLLTCPPNMQLTKAKESQLLIAAWTWDPLLGQKLLRLMISSFRRIAPACFKVEAKVSGHYVNSIMASQEARDIGFDEALLLDVQGFVAEGPGANIFIEKDGTLYTPITGSILPGITRSTVIEICEEAGIMIIEKKISPDEMLGADGAFFCGTAAEIAGIESLDNVPFKKPWNETIGATIQKMYRQKVMNNKYLQTSKEHSI